jgi:glycerol-3-phosphate acyltransferase PlsX
VSEGMASMMMKTISTSVLDALENEKGHAQKAFHGLKKRFEYNEVGGAPLLGVDGICLICHGSSDARAIRSALTTAAMLHEKKINAKIVEHLGG